MTDGCPVRPTFRLNHLSILDLGNLLHSESSSIVFLSQSRNPLEEGLLLFWFRYHLVSPERGPECADTSATAGTPPATPSLMALYLSDRENARIRCSEIKVLVSLNRLRKMI